MEKITVMKEKEKSFDLEEINFSDEQDHFTISEDQYKEKSNTKILEEVNRDNISNKINNAENDYFKNDNDSKSSDSRGIATNTLLNNRFKRKNKIKTNLGSLKITNKPNNKKVKNENSNKQSLFSLIFSFYNNKNFNIAKVLTGWFVIIMLTILNKIIAMNYSSYNNFYKNSSVISLIFSLIITILTSVSPNYFNRLFYKQKFFDYLTLSIFSLSQIYLLTYLNCFYSLVFLAICYPIFIWILINKRFIVQDIISIILYFNLISTVFISIYCQIPITLTAITVNLMILIYIILHCHVVYCLNHNFNPNGKINKDSSSFSNSSSFDYESLDTENKNNNKKDNNDIKKKSFLDKIIRLIKSRNDSKGKNSMSKMIFRVYTDSYEVLKISLNIILANNHR